MHGSGTTEGMRELLSAGFAAVDYSKLDISLTELSEQ